MQEEKFFNLFNQTSCNIPRGPYSNNLRKNQLRIMGSSTIKRYTMYEEVAFNCLYKKEGKDVLRS